MKQRGKGHHRKSDLVLMLTQIPPLNMQSMLFLFISMTAIIAQVDWTKVPAHLKFNGLNVITKCVVPGMVALTYDDGVSYDHMI